LLPLTLAQIRFKLVVVDAAASDSLAVLAREKETVRLGHDTLQQERLSLMQLGALSIASSVFVRLPKQEARNESLP